MIDEFVDRARTAQAAVDALQCPRCGCHGAKADGRRLVCQNAPCGYRWIRGEA